VPRGFAHGFCVLSEDALVLYKCSAYYEPAQEHTLLWNDPDLGIDWPVRDPVLSDKDARGRRLRELPLARRGGA
jgi:dTDP-4-dehydrorhamnose 3,5-epimerase